MRVIKPRQLGVSFRTFEHERSCRLAVTTLAFIALDEPTKLLPEAAMWKFVATELGENAVLDAGMPKVRGEAIVWGKAYPPGRRPHPACTVRAQLGPVDKTLYVVGDRNWTRTSISDPVPFSVMRLTYAQAFGGAGYPLNPLGKGAPLPDGATTEIQLPNVEDPKYPIRSRDDRPRPAGFAPYDPSWPQLLSKAGTYDEKWLKTAFPGFAADMDWGIFNVAPPDQQMEGFVRPDDSFALENLHATRASIAGRLPGYRARNVVRLRTSKGPEWRDLETRIDTVWFFPHVLRAVIVYRGVTTVADDEAEDVELLVVGAEYAKRGRERGYYEDVAERRLAPRTGPIAALVDTDLLPDAQCAGAAPDLEAIPRTEGLLAANMRRRAENELSEAKSKLRALGLDPERFGVAAEPANKPGSAPEDIVAVLDEAKARVREAMEKRKEATGQLRAALAEQGVDLENLQRAGAAAGGPPKFKAREEIQRIEQARDLLRSAGQPTATLDAKLADPELRDRLATAEAKALETYRRFAHLMPEAASPDPGVSARIGAELLAAVGRGESLAGRDFTGANLCWADLSGANLREALLEKADLSHADLSGADLSGAVLARADLSLAKLAGARLTDANLGGASLADAVLEGVSAERAVFQKADLSRARCERAVFFRADFGDAKLEGADWRRVTATRFNLLRGDLRTVNLEGADMSHGLFSESNLEGADLAGAKLAGATFLGVHGDGANLRGAVLDGARFVQSSSFARASFDGASLRGTNLRGTNLEAATFENATMDDADLSGTVLIRANLYRVVARRARLARANLTDANLAGANLMDLAAQRATLQGVSFRGANLFRADFSKIRGGAADMKDAVLDRVCITPREPK